MRTSRRLSTTSTTQERGYGLSFTHLARPVNSVGMRWSTCTARMPIQSRLAARVRAKCPKRQSKCPVLRKVVLPERDSLTWQGSIPTKADAATEGGVYHAVRSVVRAVRGSSEVHAQPGLDTLSDVRRRILQELLQSAPEGQGRSPSNAAPMPAMRASICRSPRPIRGVSTANGAGPGVCSDSSPAGGNRTTGRGLGSAGPTDSLPPLQDVRRAGSGGSGPLYVLWSPPLTLADSAGAVTTPVSR